MTDYLKQKWEPVKAERPYGENHLDSMMQHAELMDWCSFGKKDEQIIKSKIEVLVNWN